MCQCNNIKDTVLCVRCGYDFYNNVCNSIENYEDEVEEEMDITFELTSLDDIIRYDPAKSDAVVSAIICDLSKALELGLTNQKVILFDDNYCLDIILHRTYVDEVNEEGKHYIDTILGRIEVIFMDDMKDMYVIL